MYTTEDIGQLTTLEHLAKAAKRAGEKPAATIADFPKSIQQLRRSTGYAGMIGHAAKRCGTASELTMLRRLEAVWRDHPDYFPGDHPVAEAEQALEALLQSKALEKPVSVILDEAEADREKRARAAEVELQRRSPEARAQRAREDREAMAASQQTTLGIVASRFGSEMA